MATDDAALDVAESTPVEDRVYPRAGDPGVDALHYDLDLTWQPGTRTLSGVETLVFRATGDAERFQLDLGAPSRSPPSGSTARRWRTTMPARTSSSGAGDRGPPLHAGRGVRRHAEAGRGADRRTDFSTLGWTITRDDETWTMQEPFGAYSWYAVNDQPSDKALYDFTITAPAPMLGVANGTLESRGPRTARP